VGKKKKDSAPEPTLIELIESKIDDAAALGDSAALASLYEGLLKAAHGARERKLATEHRLSGQIIWAQEREEASEKCLETARKLLTEEP
jgi:hypothetical protein